MTAKAVELRIESDRTDIARARAAALVVASIWVPPVDPDALALLTTELVSNAVRLDAGPVTVRFVSRRWGIRVEVDDRSPDRPLLRDPDPIQLGGGRGLVIIDRVARRWGVTPHRGWKTVWFELPSALRTTMGSGESGQRGMAVPRRG